MTIREKYAHKLTCDMLRHFAPNETLEMADQMLGKTLQEIEPITVKLDRDFRVITLEGVPQMLNSDARMRRISVIVQGGLIVDFELG